MNKSFIVLDSCVLISFLLEHDVNYNKARAIITYLFNNLGRFTLLLSPLVVYETGVVTTRSGEEEATIAERLFRLLRHDEVIVITLSELGVFKHIRHTARQSVRDLQIKTQDMLILNTAIEFNGLLVTFDKPLLQICRNLGFASCSTPQEMIEI